MVKLILHSNDFLKLAHKMSSVWLVRDLIILHPIFSGSVCIVFPSAWESIWGIRHVFISRHHIDHPILSKYSLESPSVHLPKLYSCNARVIKVSRMTRWNFTLLHYHWKRHYYSLIKNIHQPNYIPFLHKVLK